MKTIKLIIIGIILFFSGTIQSQVLLSVNIGLPPSWGPVGTSEARYYYLPNIEAYYDVHSSMFIYYEDGNWIRRTALPDRYKHFNLYKEYKVVIKDYNGDKPYSNFSEYRGKFGRGYKGEKQIMIGKRNGKDNSGEKIALNEK